MGRRSGIEGIIMAAARASARADRQAAAAYRRELAEQLRDAKTQARERLRREKDYAKQAKVDYLESRSQEAKDLTEDSDNLFHYLAGGIIKETLEVDDTIDFENLKPLFNPPTYTIPKELAKAPERPVLEAYLLSVGRMPILGHVLPFVKNGWNRKVNDMRELFQQAFESWTQASRRREIDLQKSKQEFENWDMKYRAEFDSKCSEIEDFRSQYEKVEPEAVISYVSMVLERSAYSFEWEREYKIAYSRDSKELLVEFRLPGIETIPTVVEYKYVKAKDTIEEKLRKKSETEDCYRNLLAGIAIRTVHEIQESDRIGAIEVIDFNGFVMSIDRSNGKTVRPTVISLSASKREFAGIALSRVDPIRCLQGLSASVSRSPHELTAVKPIREFSMVDKRFIAEQEVISAMDTRQNLMELTPFQFEGLVSNLFTKMGLETKHTRSTKDGGVDAVAFDTRPILGGKIVIQAKRYKNTVGVAAVRDLYGTMINEGASKGILVATSSYGPDAFEFSKDKPIELVDGGGLLYLLNQIGVDARIVIDVS